MKPSEIPLGAARFDREGGVLRDADGAPVELRRQSMEVLQALAAQPGALCTKDELISAVWEGRHVSEDSLVQCIADIRAALGDRDRRIVETVPRKGYRLAVEAPAPVPWWRTVQAMTAAAVLVVGLVAGYLLVARGQASARPPVVAVMAFDDLSAAPWRGHLSDAIAEGIITNLARYPEMRVIARNSSFLFRDGETGIAEIGGRLGADYVLEGSQQYDGERLRVTAQLIEVEDEAHVWADSLDAPLDDLFAVNARVSDRVAGAVGSALIDHAETAVLAGEVSALLLETRARRLMMSGLTRENWAAAKALGEEALEAFPEAPWGYVTVALALRNGVRFGWLEGSGERSGEDSAEGSAEAALARGQALADRAVALAPANYVAHYAQGRIAMQRGRIGRAVAALERSAALNPSSAMVLEALGQGYLYMGQTDRVLETVARAKTVNPLYGRVTVWLEAWGLWQAERCEAAEAALRAMASPPVEARKLQAAIAACLGDGAGAARMMGEYMAAHPDWTVAREVAVNAGHWQEEAIRARWLAALTAAGLPEG